MHALPPDIVLPTLSVIRTLAVDVGLRLAAMQRDGVAADAKAGVDLVTAADRASEALITEALAQAFPHHRIIGEEGAALGPADSPWSWHVDPLDGTANFHRGLPWWSVSIGLAHGDTPVLGVVHAPVADVLVYGASGVGAWSGERPLPRATAAPAPGEWLIATDWPWDQAERPRIAALIAALAPLVRQYKSFGSAALDLANLALGRVDAYAISKIFTWDQCAGAAICAALGYQLSTWRGEAWDLRHRDVVAQRPGCGAVLGPILAGL